MPSLLCQRVACQPPALGTRGRHRQVNVCSAYPDDYDGPSTSSSRPGRSGRGFSDDYNTQDRYQTRQRSPSMYDKPPARRTRAQQLNNASRQPRHDPFASFKTYQQQAMLQAAGVGRSAVEAGMRPDLGWLPGPTPQLKPVLSRGWFAQPGFTVQTLYEEILKRCEQRRCGTGPLYMLMKLAQTREDARTVVDAIAAVRTSRTRQGIVHALNPRLCAMFPEMCLTCDAPDLLAEALQRSNELGMLLSHNRVHDVLKAWGQTLELHKIEQVVVSMERGGIPPNTKTAYIMIRAAVNSGRLEVAERYATIMQQAGVRLHHSSLRLLETGRRSQQAARAARGADVNGAGSAAAADS